MHLASCTILLLIGFFAQAASVMPLMRAGPDTAVCYIAVVITDNKGGERQSDDHADDPEQRTPDTETEEDGCRAHTRDVTHDLRRKDEVLDRLHDDEDDRHHQDCEPYRLTRLRGLQDT